MLKISCYSPSSYGNQRLSVEQGSSLPAKEPGYPGFPSRRHLFQKTASSAATWERSGRRRSFRDWHRGRGVTGLPPIRTRLCFLVLTNERSATGEPVSKSETPTPIATNHQAPFIRHPPCSRPVGGAFPAPPLRPRLRPSAGGGQGGDSRLEPRVGGGRVLRS